MNVRAKKKQKTRKLGELSKKWIVLGASLSLAVFGAFLYFRQSPIEIQKHQISQALKPFILEDQYPSEIDFSIPGSRAKNPSRVTVQYSLDLPLQEDIEALFKSYKPDYGSFVALDPRTGRILTLVSYTKQKSNLGNLTLQARFPAASVFKVVTATAALDENKASPETIIPFNGASHTLYKRNVDHTDTNRWTHFMPLRKAFALSVNTVFGKLGVFFIGPEVLRDYASRFGFNRTIEADFPIEIGNALIPTEDKWGIAEAASGFTHGNTMSPVQGALIGAAAANDGQVMEPYLVESLHDETGKPLYRPVLRVASTAMSPHTAIEIRELMRETVLRGTSRGSFKGFAKKFKDVEVGGKTGSLTSLNPKGKADWFVGYAKGHGQELAFAALTVHEKYWTVKSAYLVRRYLENYFKRAIADNQNRIDAQRALTESNSNDPTSIQVTRSQSEKR